MSTDDDLARRERAAARAKVMVIRKTRLGESEVDFTPVRGADAISLATRLTVESFSLAGVADTAPVRGRAQVRFVPRTRT